MQNMSDIMPSVGELLRDKPILELPNSNGEVVKKMRLSHPQEVDYSSTISRVTSGNHRGKVIPSYPLSSQPDRTIPTSPIIADKYQILEQVEGSSLYRCVNIKNQEELVCKILPKNNHMLVSAHYKLDSLTRISSLTEVLVGNKFLFLVFPKPHGDLHSYVRSRKKLRESEAKKLFKQIVETVQVCHNNGIVLRDLKLRKFVFADEQRSELKLESLEDAVVLDTPENDWLHDKRGCPAYVSPEILKAGQYSGRAADMWSLGVILYTMLVGRYPFSDSEHASLFAKISKGAFVIPECISPRARCLINSLLRRDPTERLTSEDILYHPWLAKSECDWNSRLSCDQIVPQSWSMSD